MEFADGAAGMHPLEYEDWLERHPEKKKRRERQIKLHKQFEKEQKALEKEREAKRKESFWYKLKSFFGK